MLYAEPSVFRIQDRLDADRFNPVTPLPTPEIGAAPAQHDSFAMRGLFGEIPGSSYAPIQVKSWSHEQ